MTFEEVLQQIQELLQQEQRVSYRGLKRRFDLDDEYLEDLKEELIGAKRLAADEDGRFLVWTGAAPFSGSTVQVPSSRGENQKPETRNQKLPPQFQPPTPNIQSPAERRQLTVMFCDLVGSTALSTQIDPEELREVVRAYQYTSTAVIERFGGHVAQYLGDGLLVYFGYPVAHEDDAARAVRAGLEIIAALQRSVAARSLDSPHPSPLPQGVRGLQVRIGIHTGPVVVGEMGGGGKREQLALGETPNLAARIQGQAAPDEVLISAATHRLVEGLFACEDRGQPELKGVSTPLTLYCVVKEGDAHSRFEVVARKGLTPLVGRDLEFSLLRERWMRATEGEGQVVLLSGEPGIGKSRLVEALKEMVEHEGAACLELRCSPYHQNSALYPVIEHVQRMFGFQREDTPEQKLQKLTQALGRRSGTQELAEQSDGHVIASAAKQSLQATEIASSPASPRNDSAHPVARQVHAPHRTLQEVVLLFATLLSLPHPEGYPPLSLSPQKQKEKTHEALVTWLCEEAKQRTVLYAWEDLHWADPSTLEVLTLFLEQAPTTRLMAVLTFRPEFTPPWGAHAYLSQLTLSRLGHSHVEAMVKKVSGGDTLSQEVVQQIASKTDGVPLFVEELTKSVIESGVDVGARHAVPLPLGIPSTLQDALMARLDRLGPAKEIAQLGATIGREFNYDLLQAVSPLSTETLQQRLRQLVEAELVYQSGVPPQTHYLFKHALVQDTAYQSLLKSRRQQLHQQVAQILAEQFPETVATQPELVAHHYTEAGLIKQAIPYWQQAGEKSVDRSAYVEAISHLGKGLELLKTLPETVECLHQELNLQTPLGLAFMATKGYGAPEVGKTYNRARELCRQEGETPQLAPVLYGLWLFYLVRAELQTAYEAAEQLLRLGQNTQDPALIMEGHHGLGEILYRMGKFAAAQEHLEQAIALYDSRPSSSHAIRPVQDPGVMSRGYAAMSLWHLGYPDQALQRVHEAFALAQELSHPFSFAVVLLFAFTIHQLRKEGQLAQEWVEAMLAFSSEHGFPWLVAIGTSVLGSILVAQGQVEEGLTQMRQSMDTYLAGWTELGHPSFLGGLAAAHGSVGRIDEGLALLTEALTVLDKTGEREPEVWLHLLKGVLLLKSRDQRVFEAEACFRHALEVARRQGAKSLELQAVMSLARLWQQQGKQHEARTMLADIYNWFTEGFDTKDLQEAQALVEELT